MKALNCQELGNDVTAQLKWMDVPVPSVGEDEILIRTMCASVNFPDTLIVQGKYQFKPDLPFAPGGELSGVIEKVGKDVEDFKVGDEVVAMVGWGAFSEFVVVPESKVLKKPKSMDFASAASFPMAFGTSFYALKRRAKLQEDETILILGAAGGVGLAAVQLAKAMGATVIAAASSEEKLNLLKRNGADFVINYRKENLRKCIKKIVGSVGVDVVYDPVGGPLAEMALRSMAWGGRYLVIGFVAGIPKPPFNLVLLKGCSIVGVFWGSFTMREPEQFHNDMMELADWHAKGLIKPCLSRIVPMSQGSLVLQDMIDRRLIGKGVLVTDSFRKRTRDYSAAQNAVTKSNVGSSVSRL
eukprot:g3442.t1